MPAVLIQIADAVVAKLNQAKLSVDFTATRAYTTDLDLKDVQDLVVTVVPKEDESEAIGRSHTADAHQVDVAVRQKVDPADNAAVDALMALVDEIKNLFRFANLAELPGVAWTGTENKPAWFPRHLREFRQFTSVITLTYQRAA